MIDEKFKDVMSTWASGVSIIISEYDGLAYGITLSSFTSVSLSPPIVSICVNKKSKIIPIINSSGKFLVNILSERQEDIAIEFSKNGRVPKKKILNTKKIKIHDQETTLVNDAISYVYCRVFSSNKAGDHIIILGEVMDTIIKNKETSPLVYQSRRFGSFYNF